MAAWLVENGVIRLDTHLRPNNISIDVPGFGSIAYLQVPDIPDFILAGKYYPAHFVLTSPAGPRSYDTDLAVEPGRLSATGIKVPPRLCFLVPTDLAADVQNELPLLVTLGPDGRRESPIFDGMRQALQRKA